MRSTPCREIREQLIEAARSGPLMQRTAAHVADCDDCARFLASQTRLSEAFAALHNEFRAVTAPLRIEAALLAELDRRKGRRRLPLYGIAAGGAIAAALVAGVTFWPRPGQLAPDLPQAPALVVVKAAPLALAPSPGPLRRALPKRPATIRAAIPPARTAPDTADVNSSPFVELPWTVPLAPGETASVVRMNLAVSALIAAGLSVDADPAEAAAADVVIGMDGRARAVRLISISSDTLNSNRRMQ